MTHYPADHPYDLLATWIEEAKAGEINDPNALYLATVDAEGQPSLRTVLLKGLDARGPAFYTNLTSRKGQELLGQRKIAILFHWKSLERQVRIEGSVEQIADEEADAYFATRPRMSQIGAHASLQSQPLPHQGALQDRIAEVEAQYADQPVPRPDHWSGFRLIPNRFEFWWAGEFRLHEREVLTPEGSGWVGQRLFP